MLYNTRELCEPKYCLSIVTDGVFRQLGPRQLNQTEDFYKHLRYCVLANLHERFEAKRTLRHYTSTHPVPRETPYESEELVFKCSTRGRGCEPIEPQMPGGTLTLGDSVKPALPELAWTVVREDGADFYATLWTRDSLPGCRLLQDSARHTS